MKDINQTPPDRMTADQRCAEIASYLAKGIVRLRLAHFGPSASAVEKREVLLGFSGDQSVHVNPSTRK